MSDIYDEYHPEKRKSPLVLVGAMATAGVLLGGLVAFKKGNQKISQQMMRARVIMQGATVALMLGSSSYYAMQQRTEDARTAAAVERRDIYNAHKTKKILE